jgi:cytochrome c oxidase subunit IV
MADTSHLKPGQRIESPRPDAAEGAVAGEEHAREHPGPGVYIKVAAWLAFATALEVGLYYLDMPDGLFIGLLMFFMVIKFSLVVAFFMHLKFDAPIFRRLLVTGIILAIVVYATVLATFGLFR